jgi:hypothetical protein
MPRSAAFHRVVGQVAYRVNGFPTDRVDRLVQDGVEEDAFNSGERLSGEAIVEGHARRFRAGTEGGAKEEASEENERKGTHLGAKGVQRKGLSKGCVWTYHFDGVRASSELGEGEEVDIGSVG